MYSRIKKKIAFVTYKNFHSDYSATIHASKECPSLTNSDNLVRKFLEKNDIECEPLAWDDSITQLLNFDMFIIRSAWNYYHSNINLNKFLKFIYRVRFRVYNSEHIIKWNFNKKYLKDLEEKEIPVIPTLFLKNPSNFTLSNFEILGKFEREREFVIKPCVSGGGRNTYRINPIKMNNKQINQIKTSLIQASINEIMIQPFIDSILEICEISFIFFGDKFSHAVQRIPAPGNFCDLVTISRVRSVPLEALEIAKKCISVTYQILHLPIGSLLYARVDLLFDKKRGYLVSELELIEPNLYLQYEKASIEKFGNTIINHLLQNQRY